MALSNRDAFKALEEIVGPEYISEEPAVLDSYAFQWGAELFTNTPFLPRSGAILMPGKTEEVQAIVKACNKYNVRYKAISNGWGFYSALGLDDNAVHVDMRRFNRIIELNEKSMYAVVEPYVTCAMLQSEAMKKGFTVHSVGAGSNTSAMPITAHQGTGPGGVSTSCGDRNTLAVEWVAPDGELIRFGSLGSGVGWFCGDGPGPSLRGLIHGPQGVMGGLGIYTKAGVKLYPYFGPPEPELEGICPDYRLKEMPPNFEVHHPIFPDWDKLIEAGVKMGESEIATLIFRLPPPMLAESMTGTGTKAVDLLERMRAECAGRPGFLVVIAGATIPEFTYRKKVFDQILAETGGVLWSEMEREDMKREYLWILTRNCTAIRESFRAAGRFLGSIGDSAMFQTSTRFMLATSELKKECQARGNVRADEGPDCILAMVYENAHTGHAEQLVMTHPNGAGWKDMMEFSDKCEDLAIEKCYTAPVTVWGDRLHDKWGPHLDNYHLWLRKIKKTFDPQGVSEPAMYISAKE
ncbi:MAG: FAD-binding oxidoreductase [Thermoleophilia bacterium]|jgi:glycolate oxidase